MLEDCALIPPRNACSNSHEVTKEMTKENLKYHVPNLQL